MKKLSFKSCRASKYCDDDIITAEHTPHHCNILPSVYHVYNCTSLFIPTLLTRSYHVTSCLDGLEQLDVTLTHPNSVSTA
jgi:hypothetical protein